ncbi:MAG: ABC transporter permease [Longimicrobiales bacterium]
MRTVRFLLRKEFKQIFRDTTMLRMLLAVPIIQLLILSSAATFEVKQARLWIVDEDQSQASRSLLHRIRASSHFLFAGSSMSMSQTDDVLLDRKASAILRIPTDFARDLGRDRRAGVQLVFDAEDGAAAGIMQSYLAAVLRQHAWDLSSRIEMRSGAVGTGLPTVEAGLVNVRHRGWYNPELRYHDYMVPGILVLLVTIIALSITSMNIVREKEIGTLEQLSVTPVTRTQLIASKLIPFWIIALFDLFVGLFVARQVFNIPVEGSLVVVAVSAVAYLFVALGIGLWISTVVDTQQQAMFIAFSINMVYLLMSGLFTPFTSMPYWAQIVGQLSPVKHFIEIMRAVLVRGAGFDAVAVPLAALVVYGIVVFGLSVRQFSKTTA